MYGHYLEVVVDVYLRLFTCRLFSISRVLKLLPESSEVTLHVQETTSDKKKTIFSSLHVMAYVQKKIIISVKYLVDSNRSFTSVASEIVVPTRTHERS